MISEVFKRSRSLTKVNLKSGSYIGFQKTSNVSKKRRIENGIGIVGAFEISEALKNNHSLTSLILSGTFGHNKKIILEGFSITPNQIIELVKMLDIYFTIYFDQIQRLHPWKQDVSIRI